MSTIDLSRQAHDPRKHYAGVRMQQGRVLTDDDFNDAAIIDAEEMRRTRLHAIGAYGTPDAGFFPKDLSAVGGQLDFKLSTGNMYLGGLRLEMSTEESFSLQKDWLNFDPTVDAPSPPGDGVTRTDLVWIECWQQPVTAVEDSELFEVALGGPDTTTRWRTMRRVHVTTGVTDGECADVWAKVTASTDFTALGTMTPEMELATDATLTVSFTAPPVVGDLCSPPQAGGYLGAENQAIRVQMVDATNYTWGFDNAAPLYRAQLSAKNGHMVKLKLLNPPKDVMHWPLKDQVVELLPWSAALVNGERVAEVAGHHLSKVAVSYNPDDQMLEITTEVPANFGTQWQARSDKADFFDGTSNENYFYLRVWNRGDDLASPALIPITTASLGHTGLQVTFNGGPLRVADYWIIAARPAAPDVMVPWVLSLAGGAGPNGIKRYRAPLALLQWTTQGGVTTGKVVHDCRATFLPLTRMRNCCSVTVGDGSESFGMFTKINDALKALPPSGGTVCILPGHYKESVLVNGLRNITLHGCGPRSRIVAPEPEGDKSSALCIQDSSDIVVESLALEGGSASVINVENSSVVRIASCLIQFRDERELSSAWSAVFVDGRMVEIENNIIEALPDDLKRVFHKLAEVERAPLASAARGGIQLAGGCEKVHVACNVIVGGVGNGITLGSIVRIDDKNPNGQHLPDTTSDDLCAPCDPTYSGPPRDSGGTVRYESAGDLYRIEIRDNVIARHGANGIAVVRFFGPAQNGLVLITVHGLRIAHNHITGCLCRAVAQAPADVQFLIGYGGIALAFATGVEIEGNVIEGNGRDWLSPVCGIFVLAANGLRIEHNRINANGMRSADGLLTNAQTGIRAGVHVWMAFSLETSATETSATSYTKLGTTTMGAGQIRVHGNEIVQPLGRALFLLGAGALNVTDNRLVSEGTGAPATDPIASTVLVANFGLSREWTAGLIASLVYLMLNNIGSNDAAAMAYICDLSKASRLMPGIWPRLPTGKLMFNDNQVGFMMRDARAGMDIASVLLLSLDDVEACDNQFEYHTQQRRVLADLLALGISVRSNDNRLAETWGRALRSILSFGLMNTATDNQSTHCVSAFGMLHAVRDNLVLAQAFCPEACANQRTLLGTLARSGQMAAVLKKK